MGKHWYNKAYSSTRGFRQFGSEFFRGVGIGSDYLRYPVHKVRQGVDFLDKSIQHGSKVPLINDTLKLLTDEPLYAESLGLVHSVDKTLEDVNQIAYDLSDAIRPAPISRQTPNYRYKHQWDTPKIAFDSGFIGARQDIARVRGEPQITGAVDPSREFQGPTQNNPNTSGSSSPHFGGDGNMGGGHIPATAQPVDTIGYHGGSIDTGYSAGFDRPTPQPAPAPVVSPQEDNYHQFLTGFVPAHISSPSQSRI